MTETKEQVKEKFIGELKALLSKYGASIEAEDHFSGYAECGEDVRMTVVIPGVYDPANGDVMREWTEIDLGRTIDADADKTNKS